MIGHRFAALPFWFSSFLALVGPFCTAARYTSLTTNNVLACNCLPVFVPKRKNLSQNTRPLPNHRHIGETAGETPGGRGGLAESAAWRTTSRSSCPRTRQTTTADAPPVTPLLARRPATLPRRRRRRRRRWRIEVSVRTRTTTTPWTAPRTRRWRIPTRRSCPGTTPAGTRSAGARATPGRKRRRRRIRRRRLRLGGRLRRRTASSCPARTPTPASTAARGRPGPGRGYRGARRRSGRRRRRGRRCPRGRRRARRILILVSRRRPGRCSTRRGNSRCGRRIGTEPSTRTTRRRR